MTSEIQKALTSTNTGRYLIPEDMERLIRGQLRAHSPLLNMIPLVKASGNIHTVVKRTASGTAWVRSEMAAPNYGASTYARRNTTVKILGTERRVSDFQQSAALLFTDSVAQEIEAATEDMRELMEFSCVWGMGQDAEIGLTGDTYQFSGVWPWIFTDGAATNVIDANGATISLSNLDAALDVTAFKYGNLKGGQWVFLASPQMISKISSLQTLVRRNVTQVEFEGGFVMDTYRGVPLLPSGYVAPTSSAVSVTGLGATAGGSGSITGNYRYKVAAITLYGEQVASAGVVGALSNSAHAALSWTANANAKSYVIYRTGAGEADVASNYDLIDIIPALTYTNGVGAPTTSPTYTDNFTKTPNEYVHPLATLEETVFLVYLDQAYGASLAVLPPTIGDTYGGDPTKNLIRYVQLNESTDSYQFRLKSFLTLQMPDGRTSAVIRKAKAS